MLPGYACYSVAAAHCLLRVIVTPLIFGGNRYREPAGPLPRFSAAPNGQTPMPIP